ncbi:class I SAM-dependent methyltransferase [Myxococcaceae bacterium JPH2]|nr:class I SAM-dependent methyltransferase [Myxococcaceae bacterium JPH2]
MPAPSPAETYLLDYHRRHAGATTRAFAGLPARRGADTLPSSYACLATEVPDDGRPRTVLDLGCGDGTLLALLAQQRTPGLTLFGLDLSAHELTGARARLGDAATLLQGRAQTLPFADASIDRVLSHLALMLMDDVETVLTEVRRVLKPGGQVSVVVPGTRPPTEAVATFIQAVRSSHAVPSLPLGDARVRSGEGLRGLFGAGFSVRSDEELEVIGDGPPERVWESLATTYDVDRMSQENRAALRTTFLAAVAPLLRSDGVLPYRWGLRQLTAARAP